MISWQHRLERLPVMTESEPILEDPEAQAAPPASRAWAIAFLAGSEAFRRGIGLKAWPKSSRQGLKET